ncbi:MAG: isoprenyl transferase [Chloroflexi bacterium]|nr:MAG: isoprenyl transferase [Chloroflexota bacterium]RLC87459.1 MAG: isoprenyl transferase [Chloroflexota bacterium]
MSSQSQNDKQYSPLEQIPCHIAIIMDGNGRWARARGLPRLAGHRAGTENLRRVLRAAVEFDIQVLTLYAFSTENWGRPKSEVQGLLTIFEQVIDRELSELHEEGIQLRHIGRMRRLPPKFRQKVKDAIELTKNNQRLTLNVAFDYGGRAELVDAIRHIIIDGVPAEQIDESLISGYLYTAGCPDPDLIIRTSGEMRLSNFLIWQSAYTEIYTTPALWPDFDKEELYKALKVYNKRERRFGLTPG